MTVTKNHARFRVTGLTSVPKNAAISTASRSVTASSGNRSPRKKWTWSNRAYRSLTFWEAVSRDLGNGEGNEWTDIRLLHFVTRKKTFRSFFVPSFPSLQVLLFPTNPADSRSFRSFSGGGGKAVRVFRVFRGSIQKPNSGCHWFCLLASARLENL